MKKYINTSSNIPKVKELPSYDINDLFRMLGFTYFEPQDYWPLWIGIHNNDVLVYEGDWATPFIIYKEMADYVDEFLQCMDAVDEDFFDVAERIGFDYAKFERTDIAYEDGNIYSFICDFFCFEE